MTIAERLDIKEIIRTFIQSSTRETVSHDDVNLFEAGLVNSLFAIQLVAFVEKQFGVEVTPDDLDIEHFKSLNAMTAFVARKQAQQNG